MQRPLQRGTGLRAAALRAMLAALSSLLPVPAPAGTLAGSGIRGMYVLPTPAADVRASASPDDSRIVIGRPGRAAGHQAG